MKKTEITVQVFEDINALKTKLENLGYTLSCAISGEDNYFTTINKNKLKNAKYTDLMQNNIIIRSINYIFKNLQENKLIYKNKIIKNDITLSEQKFETKIDSTKGCKNILLSSGHINWINIKQTNYFYNLGEIEIVVGTVEGIPYSIMEIEEYDSISKLSELEKIEKLTELAKSLNFKLGNDFSFKKSFHLFSQNNQKSTSN